MERKYPKAWKRFDELKEKYEPIDKDTLQVAIEKSQKDDSHSIKKQLDKIQVANERSQKYEPIDKDTLREELKFFMAERDLTIQDVADRIKRNPRTVGQFLNGKVKPHDRTIYKIKKLLRRTKKNQLPPKIKRGGKMVKFIARLNVVVIALIAKIIVTLAQILRHLLEEEKGAKGGHQKETKECMQKSKFMTLKETAAYLHCSNSLIYRLAATSKIPHVRISGKILFEISKIERYIEDNTIKIQY